MWWHPQGPDSRSLRDCQAEGTTGQADTALGPFLSLLGMVGGKKEHTCPVQVSLCASSQEETSPSPCTGDRQKCSALPREVVCAEECNSVSSTVLQSTPHPWEVGEQRACVCTSILPCERAPWDEAPAALITAFSIVWSKLHGKGSPGI